MKYLLFALCLISCSHQLTPEEKTRIRLDEYIGKNKEQVLQGFGFPDRQETIDGTLIIVYQELVTRGLGIYSRQSYRHTFFFFSGSIVKSWLVKYNEIPVNRIDINLRGF